MPQTGFILINKPAGPTSHDIVYRLRKITGIKKIGHAGTLDPFASGLLLCAIGRESTKEISKFVGLNKEYIAKVRLGATSTTLDRTGEITENSCVEIPYENILSILNTFIGTQEQMPPMFSAKKVGGKKLYELARQGKEVERQPSLINIYSITNITYHWPFLTFQVKVSSGTYIRTLAHDLGEKLGCGAFLEELERISIGDYVLKNSIAINDLDSENWTSRLF